MHIQWTFYCYCQSRRKLARTGFSTRNNNKILSESFTLSNGDFIAVINNAIFRWFLIMTFGSSFVLLMMMTMLFCCCVCGAFTFRAKDSAWVGAHIHVRCANSWDSSRRPFSCDTIEISATVNSYTIHNIIDIIYADKLNIYIYLRHGYRSLWIESDHRIDFSDM